MRVETLIRYRTQEKEIRLSGELVMTREAWEQRGAVYHGSLGTAAKEGWYTVRNCELMGVPVADEELQSCKDFAMYKDCYDEYCLKDSAGKKIRPCLPVFYRDKKNIWVHIQRKQDDGTWGASFECGPLATAEAMIKAEPGKYKIAGYVK